MCFDVRIGGTHKNRARHFSRIKAIKDAHVAITESASRDEHVRRGDRRSVQERMEIFGIGDNISWRRARILPAQARAAAPPCPSDPPDVGLDVKPSVAASGTASLQNHGWTASARTRYVQP